MNLKFVSLFLRHRLPTAKILLVGGIAWLVSLAVWAPLPRDENWARLLLLLAPLVLVPMGLDRVAVPLTWIRTQMLWQVTRQLTLPAALLLVGSLFVPHQGWLATLLGLPWLVVCCLLAWIGFTRARQHLRGPVWELCIDAALILPTIGAAWLLCDRWGYQPLDFQPVIVLLTAIHFHYAGFVLPLITGLVLKENRGPVGNVAGVVVIAGVPLVAIGITLTQLKMGEWMECLSAWLLASAVLVVAFLLGRMGWKAGVRTRTGGAWLVAATCLAVSMVLAATYGSRPYLPALALDLTWMRAIHGTANALGFGLVGLLGWYARR